MRREGLPSIALRILSDAGYRTSPLPKTKEYCLDLVARRSDSLLLLKTAPNVDSFSKECAEELLTLAKVFNASPILVGLRSSKGTLEKGAAYERQCVPTLELSTFEDALLREALPYVYFKRGGIYVKIDGKLLRQARKMKNMSIGELASKVGVSRKAIYAYEKEEMEATLSTAIKLEEALGTSIVSAVDVFKRGRGGDVGASRPPVGALAAQIYEKLKKMGLNVLGFRKAPFEMHVEDFKVSILASSRGEDENLAQRVELVKGIAELIGNEPVVVTGEDVKISEDVKIVKAEEMRKADSVKKVAEILEIGN